MNLDSGAVEREGLDLDANDLLLLERFEDAVKDAAFGPSVHSCIDGMPVAESFGQSAPLAAMLGHIQNGVENLKVGEADIAALTRQAVRNLVVLGFGDFHHRIISDSVNRP